MNKIYLSLGSNLGDTKGNIEHAIGLLTSKIKILKKSSYYKTEPVGFRDQPWFLNVVIEAETDLSPYELLSFLKGIEREMKRIKTIINGPRIIDIDILIYENEAIETKELTIPHPRMLSRSFVMVPLSEIAPNLCIGDRNIKEIIKSLKGEKIFMRKEKDGKD